MALLLLLLATAAAAVTLGDIARRDTGDVFTLTGEKCGAAQCAEHGAGASASDIDGCTCSCPQRAPLFREDRELCVDDLPECSLATFGTGVGVQRIPFVYLPLKGQIIHPSREITFQNVKTPICAVSGAQFLTRKGFLDLRNTLDSDVPFSLFRDEGRTFLQWSGEDDVRTRMSGRVMVVRLLCRDVAAIPASPLDLRGVFTPCVAFRVQGTPKHANNITEVQFAPDAQTSGASNTSGLTVTEYIAIGISSLLLGLIYVASVFLYLHIRKRRRMASEEGTVRRIKKIKKKDGTAITERDIIRINNERVQSLPSIGQDDGVIKKNPLLTVGRQFHESKTSFPSDSGSNMSDSEDFAESSARSEENFFNSQTTSAIVHLRNGDLKHHDGLEVNHRDESNIERLPDEHVSIVETTDDREIARPVGTTRRKLYFNPAYFEPHLMADPPAAAIEFLSKIREVIAIAKHKMASKRFQPVLNEIPEEETYQSNGTSVDIYQGLGSQRSGSAISLKRENSRKRTVNCLGCPGCQSDSSNGVQNTVRYNIQACSNCLGNKGDKQNSIREWLEKIPIGKQQLFHNDFLPNNNQQNLANSLLSLPENQAKIRKQNSFNTSNSTYLPVNSNAPIRSSSRSVRSEPPLRNYNIPLPDFENSNCQSYNHSNCCKTVSSIEDIRPIGLKDKRSGSLRSNNGIKTKRKNKILCNNNTLPDMVNDTITLDNISKSYSLSSSDEERFPNKIINTKNLNTSLRPNSDSPSGNEYETDSLERSSNKKRTLTPSEYPDVPSSQASPSLSNALPLEEELTMRNAIYKTNSSSNSETPSPQRDICVDQNHYETIELKKKIPKQNASTDNKCNTNTEYSLVSEVYVNNNYNFGSTPTTPSGSECSMGSRKLVGINNEHEEKPGCLTIEVKDPPENYIKIHESDGFEPDTLDRKHPKHKEIIESIQFSRRDLLSNLSSNGNQNNQRIQLRSSGTFKKNDYKGDCTRKYNSLRNDQSQKNLYNYPKLSSNTFSESKLTEDNADVMWENDTSWTSEEGRILTLELRHSKRQRQSTPPTIKQIKSLPRPDILPPLPPTNEIYEKPVNPPRRVEDHRLEGHPKNVIGRSLSPRTITTNHEMLGKSSETCGSSCSPVSASVVSRDSVYEDIDTVNIFSKNHITDSSCRKSIRNVSAKSNENSINTNTFVKGQKIDGSKTKLKRKKLSSIEDSGYLSSDSTSSRQFQKKLVIARIVSCSESDDTENEARSESGAESIETHSVYFGSFRKLHPNVEKCMNNASGTRDSNRIRKKIKHITENNLC
ncbi:uncharacterized protein [Epargyreus clarus]|uniref:uncharacterized protein n=1 Tax=Epargyreus clarus TaxID=520877 RepID=UPI003C2AE36F